MSSKFVQISEHATAPVYRPERRVEQVVVEPDLDPVLDRIKESKNTMLVILESQNELLQEIKRVAEKIDLKEDLVLRSIEQKHFEINDSVSKLRQDKHATRDIEGLDLAIKGALADEFRQLKALYVKVMTSVLILQVVTLLWIYLRP